jgi:hypothetical protein
MIVYDRGLKPEVHLDQGILVRTKIALAKSCQIGSTRECVESTFPRDVLLGDVMKTSTSPKLSTAPRSHRGSHAFCQFHAGVDRNRDRCPALRVLVSLPPTLTTWANQKSQKNQTPFEVGIRRPSRGFWEPFFPICPDCEGWWLPRRVTQAPHVRLLSVLVARRLTCAPAWPGAWRGCTHECSPPVGC